MLAAWFRLKYPHIAHGALASSAPILIINDFVPLYGYYNIVSKDFKVVIYMYIEIHMVTFIITGIDIFGW